MNHYLIIDDQDIDILITFKQIKNWIPDLDHIHKSNGIEALEYLADKKNPFPKFILIDIEMPIMGGFEFLKKYEKLYFKKNPKTIVIMLTSAINPRDEKKALSFKCVRGFLVKPINREKFFHFIKSII